MIAKKNRPLMTASHLKLLPAPVECTPVRALSENSSLARISSSTIKSFAPFCPIPDICSTLQSPSSITPSAPAIASPVSSAVSDKISYIHTYHGVLSVVASSNGIVTVIPNTPIPQSTVTQITPETAQDVTQDIIGRYWEDSLSTFQQILSMEEAMSRHTATLPAPSIVSDTTPLISGQDSLLEPNSSSADLQIAPNPVQPCKPTESCLFDDLFTNLLFTDHPTDDGLSHEKSQ